jgi:hypothetical protein
MMIKQAFLLIVLSILLVFFPSEFQHVLRFFLYVHNKLAMALGMIFSVDSLGTILQSVLALLIIPVVLGGLFSLIYYFIKHKQFSHTMTVIWVCWAVLLAVVLSQPVHMKSPLAPMQTTSV